MKLKKLLILILIVSSGAYSSLQGAFIDPGWGTRGAGKGGAFVATADDASTVVWNPAALSQIYMREGIFSYHRPYAGLDGIKMGMGYGAVVWPVYGIANFGVSVSMYSVNSIYIENIYQITAARELSEVIPQIDPMKLALGMNIKYLSHKYTWDDELLALNDPITEKDSAGAFTMDLGVLFQPVYEVPVGINIKNIIPADVGLVNKDIVPLEAEIGAAYRLGTLGKFEEVTPELKLGYRDQEYGNKTAYAAGVETWLNVHTVGLRCGFNSNEITFGASFEKFAGNIGFRIDYALAVSLTIGDNMGSHRISTAVKF
ncbi:MAG: hypothetical protein ABIH89_11295 [Elusimicrobiota bacterium]